MKSLVSDPEWRERAECARADLYDPDAWFDDRAFAKSVCLSRCPVVADCQVWALEEGARIEGVAGGMTEGERRRVKRTRRTSRKAAA